MRCIVSTSHHLSAKHLPLENRMCKSTIHLLQSLHLAFLYECRYAQYPCTTVQEGTCFLTHCTALPKDAVREISTSETTADLCNRRRWLQQLRRTHCTGSKGCIGQDRECTSYPNYPRRHLPVTSEDLPSLWRSFKHLVAPPSHISVTVMQQSAH